MMITQDKLAQLEAKIVETRGVLDELESAARAVREKRQHEMVEHLDELFPEAELTPGKLGPFKEEVMAEWREFIVRLKKYV